MLAPTDDLTHPLNQQGLVKIQCGKAPLQLCGQVRLRHIGQLMHGLLRQSEAKDLPAAAEADVAHGLQNARRHRHPDAV